MTDCWKVLPKCDFCGKPIRGTVYRYGGKGSCAECLRVRYEFERKHLQGVHDSRKLIWDSVKEQKK